MKESRYFLAVAKDLDGHIQMIRAETFSEAYQKFKEFNPQYKFVDVFMLKELNYYQVIPDGKELCIVEDYEI